MEHIVSHYSAREDGEIYSSYSKRILTKTISKREGYYKVTVRIGGRTTTQWVHRMIAEAFVPNPNNLPFVNHKDGDKLNNLPNNLEWVTNLENVTHAWDTGLCTHKGISSPMSKLTEDQVMDIRLRAKAERHCDLAKEFGVCKATMSQIINRKTYKDVQ